MVSVSPTLKMIANISVTVAGIPLSRLKTDVSDLLTYSKIFIYLKLPLKKKSLPIRRRRKGGQPL